MGGSTRQHRAIALTPQLSELLEFRVSDHHSGLPCPKRRSSTEVGHDADELAADQRNFGALFEPTSS